MIDARVAAGCLGTLFAFALTSAQAMPVAKGGPVPQRHDLVVRLDPAGHSIGVQDTITLSAPAGRAGATLRFRLHGGLRPTSRTAGVTLVRESVAEAAAHGQNAAGEVAVPVESYRAILPAGARSFALAYGGPIYHPLREQGEEYARSFRETAGTIEPQGVYLAGSTYWYPRFRADELLGFGLECRVPAGWEALSQGRRTRRAAAGPETVVHWDSPEPQDEFYLVAGRWTEYSRSLGAMEAMAFLRQPDEALAKRYLDASAEFLLLYERLFGTYAYSKFALVENFWETGYGMPSFTLLGPKIIRFPFIVRTSYPHEILHNWWGNSVFVDYEAGNWCEGLTAYLADHLLAEQDGGGAAYRRATLQRYSEFVKTGKDFPLTAFRGRHSSVTEAVGYGKSLMFFHMVRQAMGDEAFLEALRRFYREQRGRRATFADLERAFAAEGGPAVAREFGRWVAGTGAPELRVRDVSARPIDAQGSKDPAVPAAVLPAPPAAVDPTAPAAVDPGAPVAGAGPARPTRGNGRYRLTATIEQVQAGEAFRLIVPVRAWTAGSDRPHRADLVLAGRSGTLDLTLPAAPVRLDVDPEFDVFRRLQPDEIPPSLARAFGADRALIVVPAAAPEPLRAAYQRLAESWRDSQPGQVEVALDSDLAELPADRTVWLLGWESRFLPEAAKAASGVGAALGKADVRLPSGTLSGQDLAVALALGHPANPELAIGWIGTQRPDALASVGRKLPHYGKYGYVAFAGPDLRVAAKGEWALERSPMTVWLAAATDTATAAGATTTVRTGLRVPLSLSPAAVSAPRMQADVRHLAGAEFAGRGLGTAELDRAAEFIAAEFRAAGLEPGGDEPGSYLQSFAPTVPAGAPPVLVARNVVGLVRGTRAEWASQSVVVGAHYDHLGRGWPDAHEGDAGKPHPGAADNASGVAAMLELARLAGPGWKPERSIVFVAFTGEEAGRLGSRHFVSAQRLFPARDCAGMVNLDTVGRFGDGALTMFGAGTADFWARQVDSAGRLAGIKVKPVARAVEASDDQSFLAAGVPAVHLFSGPNPDYHRPTDTADKVEPAALVAAAQVAGHLVLALADRPAALLTDRPAAAASEKPVAARRVSLGTMPDLAFGGTGCRVAAVTPGSPADKAGIRAGDVIVSLGDAEIRDARDLARALGSRQPGDQVEIALVRDGQTHRVSARLIAR